MVHLGPTRLGEQTMSTQRHNKEEAAGLSLMAEGPRSSSTNFRSRGLEQTMTLAEQSLSYRKNCRSKESVLSSRGLERLRSLSMSFRSTMGPVQSPTALVAAKKLEAPRRLVL
jgi:hypothetical protein